MMKVWVMQGIHEGELFSTIHMTEKGAALSAISDVLEFLGVDCDDTALSVMNSNYEYTETDGIQTEPYPWEFDKLQKMTRKELWQIFSDWSQLTWDNSYGYQIDVITRTIEP